MTLKPPRGLARSPHSGRLTLARRGRRMCGVRVKALALPAPAPAHTSSAARPWPPFLSLGLRICSIKGVPILVEPPAAPREREAQVPEGEGEVSSSRVRGHERWWEGRRSGAAGEVRSASQPSIQPLTACPGRGWCRGHTGGSVGVWRAFSPCPPGSAGGGGHTHSHPSSLGGGSPAGKRHPQGLSGALAAAILWGGQAGMRLGSRALCLSCS